MLVIRGLPPNDIFFRSSRVYRDLLCPMDETLLLYTSLLMARGYRLHLYL